MKNVDLGKWILDHRKSSLALVIVLLVAAVSFYGSLRFDNTPGSFFMQDDPTLLMYERYKDTFGSDEYTFIVIDSPEVWTADYLGKVDTLTREIESMDYVMDVTSITNVRHVKGSQGAIDVGPFLAPDDMRDADLSDKKQVALNHPFYKDFLISRDGDKLGILAQTELRPKEVMYKINLVEDLRSLLSSEKYSALNARLVGAPVIDADVFKIVNIESAIFGSLSFTLVAIGFYFIFRSKVGTIVPLTVATLSIMFAAGVMGAMGAPAGLLTPIVPGFLISVGVGSSVFLLTEIYQHRMEGKPLRAAISDTYRQSAFTSVISVLTTAGALFSFSWSDIKPVQEVGLVMGAGLLASVVFALVLIPLALTTFGGGEVPEKARRILSQRSRRIDSVADFVMARWRLMLGLLVVLLAVAVVGISKLRVDYHYVGLFKEETDIYQSYQYVDDALRGAASMEVIFDSGESNATDVKDPSVLRAMAEFQQSLETEFDHLGLETYSAADLVMEINQAVHQGSQEAYRIPDSRAAVAEALFLYEASGDDELEELLSANSQQARVNLRLKYRPESEYAALFEAINNYSASENRPNAGTVDVYVTGVIPLWSRLTTYLYETELEAILLSALIVLLVMMLVFRSILLGAVMMLCNLFPVAFTLGLAGLLNIFIDPFTMLVAAIAIGMIDDDTIHFVRAFLGHYNSSRGDFNASLKHAFHTSGQAMILLSIVLVAGFLVYNLSSVNSLSKFGSLTAMAIGFGAISEFLFTPAVLILCEKTGIIRYKRGDTLENPVATEGRYG